MSSARERLFARARPLDSRAANRSLWLLVALALSLCAWASLARIEEQIRAPGKVIVSSRSQIVQAVDGGVLRKLTVKEGDFIKAGDLLAELDPARIQASNDEVRSKMVSLKATVQRLEAELSGRPLRFSEEVSSHPEIVSTQRALHERRLQLQREELSGIQTSLRLAQEEEASIKRLAQTGDAARSEVLKAERQVNDLQALETNKRNAYRQEAQADLVRSRGELEQTAQVLAQRNEALQSTVLRAPMSGTVNNVKFTTIGAVIKSGEELLQIVPSDEPLIVEARVRSADVAFLRNDLRASVKLDAYDYTIYGLLEGHVSYISPDTLEEDLRQDEQPYYRVLIVIDQIPTRRAESLKIIPGMTSLVQIVTGERTVAQYLLKPLRRTSSEALTER